MAKKQSQLTVDDRVFVGRVEEQKQFRAALAETLNPPAGENLPYVFLLYGDGGIGKTTLAKRFRDIALQEAPFKDKVQMLWIDWEDERKKFPELQVGREQIQAEDVFDVIRAAAVRNRWGRQFVAYTKALKQTAEAKQQVAEMLTTGDKSDELALVHHLSVAAIAKIVRAKVPIIGDTGEQLIQAFVDAGLSVGVEKAAQLRSGIETLLRAHLEPNHFSHFLNPNEQLGDALARGIGRVGGKKPLLVVLDSYEIVDRTDIWIREVIRSAGPNVIWVISGRNDLLQSRRFGNEYFKGYADDSPRRVLGYDMLPLAVQDIKSYFTAVAPERAIKDAEVDAISRATRGIPLAIQESMALWQTGATLDAIVGEMHDSMPGSQIVSKMTDRYLQHVVVDEDKYTLYALALAGGDVDILRAMLKPEG
ncbi:MAG: ATP-binding protein, partial [Anaerolineales bacterium]|nr:ATP-binding protein [Anaerolineales bacterium]